MQTLTAHNAPTTLPFHHVHFADWLKAAARRTARVFSAFANSLSETGTNMAASHAFAINPTTNDRF